MISGYIKENFMMKQRSIRSSKPKFVGESWKVQIEMGVFTNIRVLEVRKGRANGNEYYDITKWEEVK